MEAAGYGAWSARSESDLPSVVVPLSCLVSGTSPRRRGEDGGHARMLADLGDALPPIIVHRPTMRVIDGMHRLRAARLRGADKIEVRFFDGDEDSAFVLAVRMNIAHGLPLSPGDRKAAADRIIASYPQWSDRAIASATGLSAPTVAARRRRLTENNLQPDTRIGLDGRVRPTDSASRRQAAVQALADNPGASLREVARKVGLSPETVRQLRAQAAARGGTAGRQPSSRGGERARAGSMALRGLLGDPAFRSTDSGRALLRLLCGSAAVHDNGADYIDKTPTHCLSRLAEAARASARDWENFAAGVERRQASLT